MADPTEPTNATRPGGVRPRPDDRRRVLTGDLPGDADFAAEFPGGDLLSAMLARALERIGTEINAEVTQAWRPHGLSHAGGNALAVIEGAGRPLTPGEISAAMHTTSGSITSLIDTLVKKGLVRRTDHADDRRKVLIELTASGQTLLDEALPSVVLRARDVVAGLTDDERRQLLALIEKLHASIGTLDLTTIPTGTRHRPGRHPTDG